MKTVAILQSNYLPWKGYFDIIASVDEFIIYDSVQYTKNDWRNRNQIKTPNGKTWLTVPVRHLSTDQLIEETCIADTRSLRKHWTSIKQNYAKAGHIKFCMEIIEPILCSEDVTTRLSELNATLIRTICDAIGIRTTITDSRDYTLLGDRNQRLVELCRQSGATHYLSGPAAQSYLDLESFKAAGIEVTWKDYRGYPEYEQPHPPFDHSVSIVDLLCCTGPDAYRYVRQERDR